MAEDKKRGFAGMSPEKHREIAKRGGIACHAQGKGHEFTSEEARAAGHKGGCATARNREHMRAIGKKGGAAPHKNRTPSLTDENV